jgi:hypothetical protein
MRLEGIKKLFPWSECHIRVERFSEDIFSLYFEEFVVF